MKGLSMALVLIPALYWLSAIEIVAVPQGSNPQKTTVANGKQTPSEEKAKILAPTPHQIKEDPAPLVNEDCGCETSLFGEPVNPAEKRPSQENSEKGKESQELKTKAKDTSDLKPGSKSEKKEGTKKKQGKPQSSSPDTNRPK